MLAGCYHEGSDKHHVGLFKIGEANLEKKCCTFVENWYFTISRSSYMYNIFNLVHGQNILHHQWTWSRSSYTISSTWYKDMTSYIICGHDPQNRKKDNRQKCGDRKRGSLHITYWDWYICKCIDIENIENIETIAILQYCEDARKIQCLTVYLCHPKDCHQKKKKPHTGLEENFTK